MIDSLYHWFGECSCALDVFEDLGKFTDPIRQLLEVVRVLRRFMYSLMGAMVMQAISVPG